MSPRRDASRFFPRYRYENFSITLTVDEVTHIISCRIGVKQGNILDPILFTLFLAAVRRCPCHLPTPNLLSVIPTKSASLFKHQFGIRNKKLN